MLDYQKRSYLSATEAAFYTGVDVKHIHSLIKKGLLKAIRSTSGQYRIDIKDLSQYSAKKTPANQRREDKKTVEINECTQTLFCEDARNMNMIDDETVHLAITSPPYFNAKMYSQDEKNDLGNIHDIHEWFSEIAKVWQELFRVLQPGRKFFLNIMNLPIRENNSFRSINLVGKSIDACEEIGFIFKREIVWHKTNGVRAHFGTYPYPGGILINHMHESIIELEKPAKKGTQKYLHVTPQQKEQSKLDKDFWLSIKKSDVWTMKPENSGDSRSHIAPFPLEIPERLIKAYSYIGETILDPFMGSGSTMLAALLHQRHGIGYEVNVDIFAKAYDRLAQNRMLWK